MPADTGIQPPARATNWIPAPGQRPGQVFAGMTPYLSLSTGNTVTRARLEPSGAGKGTVHAHSGNGDDAGARRLGGQWGGPYESRGIQAGQHGARGVPGMGRRGAGPHVLAVDVGAERHVAELGQL